MAREAKVLGALGDTPQTLKTIVEQAYADAPPIVRMGPKGGIAGRSATAHLIKLEADGHARKTDDGWARA